MEILHVVNLLIVHLVEIDGTEMNGLVVDEASKTMLCGLVVCTAPWQCSERVDMNRGI